MKKFAVLLLLTFAFVGCTQQKESPDELREKTAQATAKLKKDTRAIAEGIKEGWSRDKPLDINEASKDELLGLPGITGDKADLVIARRPYKTSGELVSRHVLTQTDFERIRDEITTKKSQ